MLVFDLLKDILLPHKSMVFLAMFVVFFSFLGAALYKNDNVRVRQTFLTFFFICLLLTSLGGQHVLPFTQWHKFSTTGETDPSVYQVHMVTEDGSRIEVDSAVTEVAGSQLLASKFASGYSDSERDEAARTLISRSNAHRAETLESRRIPASMLAFPPHGFGARDWSEEFLSTHGEFIGVAIVRMDLTFSEDGTTLEQRSTEEVCHYRLSQNFTDHDASRIWEVAECS